MSTPARRHALTGLAVAGLAGVLAAWWLLGAGQRATAAFGAEREAVVSAQALTELVTRAGLQGDAVREVVARVGGSDSTIRAARVVVFSGLLLEASSFPQDTGDNAAPRRLARDEKAIFDQGQRLRVAVDTNREDQVAMREEIEVTPLADRGLEVAVPLFGDGGVVGFVQVATEPPPVEKAGISWWVVVLAGLLPLLALALLVGVLPEPRLLLSGVALTLLAAGLAGFVWAGGKALVAGRQVAEEAVAAHVRTVGTSTSAVAYVMGLGEPELDPVAWDVNRYRKPYELVTAQGEVDAARLGEAVAASLGAWRALFWVLGPAAGALLLFFSTGLAARTWRTLVVNRGAYTYVSPAMLGMLVLVFFPFFYGIALSFTGSTIYTTDKSIPEIWVGLQNYKEIISDVKVAEKTAEGWVVNYQNFYWTLWMTVAWTISNVAIGVSVGLMLALILNIKGLRLRPMYRVLLILPWAVPNYITALIWKGMFHQQFGVINQILQMVGMEPVSWFERPFTSFLACLATNGWLSFPFMMVISLGALQSIPADLYEAARVDGASRWRQFLSITLPSLKPALVPAIILSVVWTFNMFNIIYLVSGGEPAHSTEILITQAYKLAFEQYRYGYAAAYSTVIFAILLLYGTWQNRVTKATEGI